ncbi:MAG: fibronectin type III domain-containing protein [Spirochaetia bacterium]
MKNVIKRKKHGSVLLFSALITAAFIWSCSTADMESPIPGNGGTLVLSGVSETEATVIWSRAADLTSDEPALEYRLVYSESPNLETPEKAETNGTVAVDWTAGITTGTVTGLSADTEYHFNVVVRDEAGNSASYVTIAAETFDGTVPSAGKSGNITVSDVGKTSVQLDWEHGSDGTTPAYALEYKGVYSTSGNISTASDAEANGSLIFDWTPDVVSAEVTGLTQGTAYFFNILVRDAEMNAVPYTASSAETLEPLLFVADELGYKLKAVTLDGSESSVVIDDSVAEVNPTGIAVGAENSVVYWTEYSLDRIMKGNLDGSGVDVFLEGAEVSNPVYIELDPEYGILYWINRGDTSIKRVNLAGTIVETVETDVGRLDSGMGLELDVENKILYWTNFGTIDGIFSVNTDGTDFTAIVTAPDAVYPLGVALDKVNEVLYWAELSDTVKKVNSDGTGIADVTITGVTSPTGVFFSDDILYVTDATGGKVFASGGSVVELDDDYDWPSDLEIWDPVE